jgi:predicted metal-dependent enzyme (double-stranded beta helix superfamily)
MFNRDSFLADCLAAVKETDSHKAVRELVLRAIGDVEAIIAELGEPRQATVEVLHASNALTILNGVSGPWMTVPPHDHRMWAVIGVYTGREDNVFWRRIPSAEGGLIEAAGAKSISAGEAHPMGRDIIHTFTNPLTRLTGALHVYGGNLLQVPRSEWDHETLEERPLDPAYLRRLVETSNRFIGNARHAGGSDGRGSVTA